MAVTETQAITATESYTQLTVQTSEQSSAILTPMQIFSQSEIQGNLDFILCR